MAKLKTTNPFDEKFFDGPTPPAATTPVEPQPAAPKGSTVRLNLDLDRAIHRELKRLALDEDRSVADVVRELIQQAVKDR